MPGPLRFAVILPLLAIGPPRVAATTPTPACKRVPRHDHLRPDTGHGVKLNKAFNHTSHAQTDNDQDQQRRTCVALALGSPSFSMSCRGVADTHAFVASFGPLSPRRSRAPPLPS